MVYINNQLSYGIDQNVYYNIMMTFFAQTNVNQTHVLQGFFGVFEIIHVDSGRFCNLKVLEGYVMHPQAP
jgi:hypothetical protein